VTVFGTIAGAASGVKENSAQFALVDPQGGVQARGAVTLDRFGGYFFTTELQASDLGSERDSRTFMITVSALDNAGNQSFSSTAVVVPRD
jgi:hypothetical protein